MGPRLRGRIATTSSPCPARTRSSRCPAARWAVTSSCRPTIAASDADLDAWLAKAIDVHADAAAEAVATVQPADGLVIARGVDRGVELLGGQVARARAAAARRVVPSWWAFFAISAALS